jgi:glycerol-3-phosphate O-acyltransferase/dihydroxyacetone phosphate acyltransferase
VDPLVLMRMVRTEAKRRVSTIIAAKSMKRKFVGFMAGVMGSISVGRALDLVKPAKGKVYFPDPDNDPLLIRGVGTDFEKEAMNGGLIVLPTMEGETPNTEILEIKGPEELRLKKEMKGKHVRDQLSGEGTKFKLAPKVDQSDVYNQVFDRLNKGGCVCIFPEGGSHDRTELLPLKAGVAIMALGSLAANPDSGLKIVCCGMNYFHAHKFRSRAVVEFGAPIEVPKDLVEMYRDGERREATRQLLEIIYNGLTAVTVQSPDYDTLMLIQAVRRLYKPKGKKLPLPKIIELNRRLAKGYERYKDDPRIVDLKKDILAYNKQLWLLGVRDHQVEYASFSTIAVIGALIYRVGKLFLLSIGTLPGLVLFAPVFIASKIISVKKSREALAASTVKLQGRDVLATWKLLVAMAFAPLLYTFYTVSLTVWTYENRVQGYMPEWVPLWLVVALGYIIFPTITFAALRIGEIGMDILKSLRPLSLCLNPTASNTFVKLRARRENLTQRVTELINTLGPEVFDDFGHNRLIANPVRDGFISEGSPPATPDGNKREEADTTFYPSPLRRQSTSHGHDHLPQNKSFSNLGNMEIFSTRPPSRSRSRSRSNSSSTANLHGLKSLSTIESPGSLDEVSKRIRGAMKERGQERARARSEGSWEFAGSGHTTPGSDETKKDM